MSLAPVITTARLRLRDHRISDLDAFCAFYGSDRAKFVGGPLTRKQVWYGFASETGSWALCGHGGWAVETHDGQLVGQVAITQPPHFAELELGWILFDGFEGKGYAFEAAQAARDYAFTALNAPTLVSYIDPDNIRSAALARRLGAAPDPDAKRHHPQDVVYRHPHPDARTDGGIEAYA